MTVVNEEHGADLIPDIFAEIPEGVFDSSNQFVADFFRREQEERNGSRATALLESFDFFDEPMLQGGAAAASHNSSALRTSTAPLFQPSNPQPFPDYLQDATQGATAPSLLSQTSLSTPNFLQTGEGAGTGCQIPDLTRPTTLPPFYKDLGAQAMHAANASQPVTSCAPTGEFNATLSRRLSSVLPSIALGDLNLSAPPLVQPQQPPQAPVDAPSTSAGVDEGLEGMDVPEPPSVPPFPSTSRSAQDTAQDEKRTKGKAKAGGRGPNRQLTTQQYKEHRRNSNRMAQQKYRAKQRQKASTVDQQVSDLAAQVAALKDMLAEHAAATSENQLLREKLMNRDAEIHALKSYIPALKEPAQEADSPVNVTNTTTLSGTLCASGPFKNTPQPQLPSGPTLPGQPQTTAPGASAYTTISEGGLQGGGSPTEGRVHVGAMGAHPMPETLRAELFADATSQLRPFLQDLQRMVPPDYLRMPPASTAQAQTYHEHLLWKLRPAIRKVERLAVRRLMSAPPGAVHPQATDMVAVMDATPSAAFQQAWQRILAQLCLTDAQIRELLKARDAALAALQAVYQERSNLRDWAAQIMLGPEGALNAKPNSRQNSQQTAEGGADAKLAPIWQAGSEIPVVQGHYLAEALDITRKSLRSERKVFLDLHEHIIITILNPVQAAVMFVAAGEQWLVEPLHLLAVLAASAPPRDAPLSHPSHLHAAAAGAAGGAAGPGPSPAGGDNGCPAVPHSQAPPATSSPPLTS